MECPRCHDVMTLQSVISVRNAALYFLLFTDPYLSWVSKP